MEFVFGYKMFEIDIEMQIYSFFVINFVPISINYR